MTDAQKQQIAHAMEAIHDHLGDLPDQAACVAVLGFFSDRPNLDTKALTDLSNELGRLAHMQERAA